MPVQDQLLPAMAPLLNAVNLIGIAVFAASGGILAARKQQTLVTFIFFATVTGVGGGTVRDLIIGAPVFWVHENMTLLICLLSALAVWMTPAKLWEGKALDWLDALGLAAYASFGAAKAVAAGVAPVPAIALGVITGCVGGIIRDTLAGEPSILMRPELYVTAAALSAGLMVLLPMAGVAGWIAASAAVLCGFALRGYAIRSGLGLPIYDR